VRRAAGATTLSITVIKRDIQHNCSVVMLSVVMLNCTYKPSMPNVTYKPSMLSVVKLNVSYRPSMLNVIMLNVTYKPSMLSLVALCCVCDLC
jgi:hypothetical protein